MKDYSVYIILVNYKAAKDTLECVDSIKNQSYGNIQTVIIDNDPNDNCKEYVKQKWPDVQVFINQDNEGFAKANNSGIAYAMDKNADFVLILNNDTILEKDCVAKLISFYMDHLDDNIGVLSGKILLYYEKNIIWHAGGYLNSRKGSADILGFGETDLGQYNQVAENSFASGCCMFIPMEVIRTCGMMNDEFFLYYEDVDYCCNIMDHGYKIWNNNEAIIYHKESVSTKKGSKLYSYYFARNRYMFIKKHIRGTNKLISYVYTFLWLCKKTLRKELQLKYVVSGIRDFQRHVTGRKDF